jgi:hypothetical protein
MFQESLAFFPADSIYDICAKNSVEKWSVLQRNMRHICSYLQGRPTLLQLFFEEPMPTVRLSEENSVWLAISVILYSIQ